MPNDFLKIHGFGFEMIQNEVEKNELWVHYLHSEYWFDFYLEFNQILQITESQALQHISDNSILKITVVLNYFLKLD